MFEITFYFKKITIYFKIKLAKLKMNIFPTGGGGGGGGGGHA